MMRHEMIEICGFQCVRVVPISAGMSSDEKYDVTLTNGRRCMLRVSPGGQSERKKAEYSMLETAGAHGICVPRPYKLGTDAQGRIFQLTQWLEGRSLEEELSECTGPEKYEWGVRSGLLLKQIHEIPAPLSAESWKARFRRKIEIRISEGKENMNVPEYMDRICRYLLEKIDMLDACRQCFSHGDFYPGNLMCLTDGSLAAIDFNAYNGGYGDPVFETASILLDRHADADYRKGFTEGYYGAQAGQYVQQLLEYYRGYVLLAELCETEDESERDDILARMHELADRIM